jgi:hypothetical protein
MYAYFGQKPHYWSDKFNNKRPAFWVPHDHLWPMEELPNGGADGPF